MARRDGYQRPSEHRRYIRLMEDMLDCPKLAQVDGDGFRAYVQILLMLNRAKSRDGSLTLNQHAAMAATRKGRKDAAFRLLRCLADVGLMSVEHRGDVSVITVPKWSELQGYASPPVPVPVPKGESAPSCTQKRLQSPPKDPEGGGSSKPRQGAKGELTETQVAKLRALAPIGLAGQDVTDAEIRCWFAATQPKMVARGVKSTWRAALNWWPKVHPDEIRDAVRWVRLHSYALVVVSSEPREEDDYEDFAAAFDRADRHREEVRDGKLSG